MKQLEICFGDIAQLCRGRRRIFLWLSGFRKPRITKCPWRRIPPSTSQIISVGTWHESYYSEKCSNIEFGCFPNSTTSVIASCDYGKMLKMIGTSELPVDRAEGEMEEVCVWLEKRQFQRTHWGESGYRWSYLQWFFGWINNGSAYRIEENDWILLSSVNVNYLDNPFCSFCHHFLPIVHADSLHSLIIAPYLRLFLLGKMTPLLPLKESWCTYQCRNGMLRHSTTKSWG